ncbi:MAG: type II secretion system protein GspE, partial [Candidatus Omnitrophica bacterium]|nr:type II secretion system protein GspE [Candidatus Omnitrophota bacterium]
MPTVYETTRLIGEQLVRKKVLTQTQLKEAVEKQRLSGRLLGDVLIELGYATEDQVTEALSEQVDIPFVDVSTYEIDPTLLSAFPAEFLREQFVIPLFKIETTYTVAMADPMNIRVIDRLRFISHGEVEPVFGTKTSIRKALDQ